MSPCTQFRELAGDLASGRLMEASARDFVLGHAAECQTCAGRLEVERALSESLGEFAGATAAARPPAELKSSLMAAFGEHRAAAAPVASAPDRGLGKTTWWFGAVAAGLLLVAIPAGLWFGDRAQQNASTGESAQMAPAVRRDPVAAPPPAPGEPAAVTPDPDRPAKAAPRKTQRKASSTVAAGEESTTDFIPLTYVGGEVAMESGHIIRVEVPRSTLVSMGFPVNVDRTESVIQADVMVGDDGVARAIRFVDSTMIASRGTVQ